MHAGPIRRASQAVCRRREAAVAPFHASSSMPPVTRRARMRAPVAFARLSGSQALGLSGSRVLGFSGSRVLGFSGSRALGSSGHQVLRRRFSGPASLRILNVPALARSIPSARRLAPLVSACPRAPRPTFAFRRPCAPAGIGAANAAAARRNGPPPHVQRAATSCLPGSREPSAASLPQPPPSARIRLTVDTACVPVNWFDCSCDSSTERSLSITSR
ncbi:Uncharacterised protein [Burkholderia pseudomallei]|nr:hypothetical protein DR56_3801 [Burkholderia pseudomallei MSHR5858]AIP56091.1 hypothetical protein DR54_5617 [Burkholderia pseudomallei HBPUB10303a]CAJ3280543.1 Uncharacterised protein [Burkholderia pseudomallei]CAJ3417676.1 Uncharacterised protein [Burkholderia pseudomallei]CAJ3612064.1 Uncharacterised protein [Burkholderia pseudomallei]